MSFLYPIFLLAGIALAIPVLIHLFNLRRYKTVMFPHTRFLKNIQTHSRKQREVRYKWLLLTRLLLLALLVLAFAQPFRRSTTPEDIGNRLQVIYLDNSQSMSVQNGQQRLLDIARHAIRQQLQDKNADTRFLLLTNDRMASYRPVQAEKIQHLLDEVDLSPLTRTPEQVLAMIQNIIHNESAAGADLYYYSDFQQNTFVSVQDTSLLQQVRIYGIPVQAAAGHHLFIDTAWIASPALEAGRDNQVVVKIRKEGPLQEGARVLQLDINGQVKSAVSLAFPDGITERLDTLAFRINDAGWQQITLTVNDHAVRFDDTFRITARTSPGLSVLVLNEGAPNPYIQAAFHAWQGFRLTQADVQTPPQQLRDYNLIILNSIKRLSTTLGTTLADALQQGKSICIFPGRTDNFNALNEGLRMLADIEITAIDTAVQTVSELQQGSDLVKDIFERIPENVQLPVANWHYIIRSGLNANQQSVMSFRNGDPFLARYTPTQGHLYVCAAAADLFSGNFTGSYFFVPFLYQMGMQSGGDMIYAVTAGQEQPVYVPVGNAGARNVVHIYGNGTDAIPPQRAARAGLYVYTDRVAAHPGFYTLAAAESDTIKIALNADRSESSLAVWSPADLKKQWPQVNWLEAGHVNDIRTSGDASRFPLWKVCITLALLMLLAETLLLTGRISRQNVATQ